MSRWLVVAGLFVLSLITYVDRAAISSVKEPMSAELALSDQQVGFVFSAFALGYALAQVPSGWLADRMGPRLMLFLVVALWSLLTASTGLVYGFASMAIVRFLFGVAEAGAFPGSARAFYNWLPSGEHGRANGIIFSASRLGAAGAFPLMALLLEHGSWRRAFLVLALPGLIWAAAWIVLFRNHPATPLPLRDEPEKTSQTLASVLRTAPMALAMVQYFIVNLTTFLCLSWMQPYLKERYQLTLAEAAFYTMAILLVAATAQWFTGFLVDRLYGMGRAAWSRRLPAMLGFLVSACGVGLIPWAPSATTAAACFALAAFGIEMVISPSWAFCMDIGGPRSGAVTGAMNMAGNIGSFASANAFPWLQGLTGSAAAYFQIVMLLNLAGAACWWRMRPDRPFR